MLSRVSRQIFSQRGSNSHVPQDPMATGDVSMSLFLQLVLRNKKFKKIDFGPRSKKKKKNPVLDSLLCCRLSYLYQPRRSHRVISWLLACFNITRVSSPTQATTAQVHHTTFTSDVLVTKQTWPNNDEKNTHTHTRNDTKTFFFIPSVTLVDPETGVEFVLFFQTSVPEQNQRRDVTTQETHTACEERTGGRSRQQAGCDVSVGFWAKQPNHTSRPVSPCLASLTSDVGLADVFRTSPPASPGGEKRRASCVLLLCRHTLTPYTTRTWWPYMTIER